jgi:hypothetical protein
VPAVPKYLNFAARNTSSTENYVVPKEECKCHQGYLKFVLKLKETYRLAN